MKNYTIIIISTFTLIGCNGNDNDSNTDSVDNTIQCYSKLNYDYQPYSNDPSFSDAGVFIIEKDTCAMIGEPKISEIQIDGNHVAFSWSYITDTMYTDENNGNNSYFKEKYSQYYTDNGDNDFLTIYISKTDATGSFKSNYKAHTLYFNDSSNHNDAIEKSTLISSSWNGDEFIQYDKYKVNLEDSSTWGVFTNMGLNEQEYIQKIANQFNLN